MSDATISDPASAQTPSSKPPLVRWTLGDAFFFMTFLCVLFAVIGWVGTASPFLWMSLIAALVLTGFFTVLLPKKTHGCLLPLPIVIGVGFFGPLMIVSLVTVLNCALHLVLLGIYGRGQPCNYKTALKGSLACLAISFFAGSLLGVPGFMELKQAREKLAPVSLAGRLDYEPKPAEESEGVTELPFRWEEWELEQQNRRGRYFSRIGQLESLHNRQTESFIKSPGFGIARMMPRNPGRLANEPPLPTISFEDATRLTLPRYEWWYDQWEPTGKDFETMHVASAANFLNEGLYGLATDSGERIGFVPHAAYAGPIENDFTQEWHLKSLRLVSLRRFGAAKVYQLDHLPRMDDLSGDDAPTRDLDEFETEALEKLRQGEPFVTRESEDGTRLVALGPLLAIGSCLQCHSARRGDLLGAFTYEFDRRDADEPQDGTGALLK